MISAHSGGCNNFPELHTHIHPSTRILEKAFIRIFFRNAFMAGRMKICDSAELKII